MSFDLENEKWRPPHEGFRTPCLCRRHLGLRRFIEFQPGAFYSFANIINVLMATSPSGRADKYLRSSVTTVALSAAAIVLSLPIYFIVAPHRYTRTRPCKRARLQRVNWVWIAGFTSSRLPISSDAAVGFGLVVGKALVRSNDHARHSAEEGQATAERNTKKRHAATSFVASAASDRASLG